MKSVVRCELERDGYRLLEEPLFPPSRRLSWFSYRPDLLGVRRDELVEEIVIVECETHPNMRRFRSKNYSSVWFQSTITREGKVRRILAIPRGTLDRVDLTLRDLWEVWILGERRPMERFGTFSATETAGSQESLAAPALRRTGNFPLPIRARRTLR